MEPETTSNPTPDIAASAERLAAATASFEQILQRLDAQFDALHAKVDRIVATIDSGSANVDANDNNDDLETRVKELEQANQNLKAEAEHARRKTLSPVVSTLLAKHGADSDAAVEPSVIEKALANLSIEQRIAVKAELARAGLLL